MKLFLTTIFAVFSFISFGFTPIKLFTGSYSEALELAQKSNKLVLVELAGSWSSATKRMDLGVLSDSLITTYAEEHFIMMRLDANTAQAIALEQKFGLFDVPAFLVLTSTGEARKLRIGETGKDSFLTFLQEAVAEPNGLKTLESESLRGFNASAKTPADYTWCSYNFLYLLAKPEIAYTLCSENQYRPRGSQARTEVFNILMACARNAGKTKNDALLNELGLYTEKISFGSREQALLKAIYALESNDVAGTKKYLSEIAVSKDRFSDFQFTGVLFAKMVQLLPELETRLNDYEVCLQLLEGLQTQSGWFERVYPERIYKYNKAVLLEKLGHQAEAKVLAKEILPSYEFIAADAAYDEDSKVVSKILEERE